MMGGCMDESPDGGSGERGGEGMWRCSWCVGVCKCVGIGLTTTDGS